MKCDLNSIKKNLSNCTQVFAFEFVQVSDYQLIDESTHLISYFVHYSDRH